MLPAGKTVAIVGENGAGKTTLVKLLARLYEPSAGRILVDGVDLRRFAVEAWRRAHLGRLPGLRALRVRRARVGRHRRPAESGADDARARRRSSARRPATSSAALPDGLETPARAASFDGGIDLSIGQWQKVALGRAMMRGGAAAARARRADGEPGRADRARLFERFAGARTRAAARTGAITILVSHRFSTVRMADLILVVDDGRIAEARHARRADAARRPVRRALRAAGRRLPLMLGVTGTRRCRPASCCRASAPPCRSRRGRSRHAR